jgi:hypothetical protein
VRYPFKGTRIPRKRHVLSAVVIERNLKSFRYKILYKDPISKERKSDWVSVEKLIGFLGKRSKLAQKSLAEHHKGKFYIPFTRTDRLEKFNEMSVSVLFAPVSTSLHLQRSQTS